ncbi:hypothetical protein [Paraburkholderia aromaticivorans]|uniref:hypothetical protein n=1 Tax=Paraburkholderia aromaticivorans TaxID=2026199 RepID=UPI001FC9A73B|nr:hypothetical protein [Paraburkholderia aromaticivorans]
MRFVYSAKHDERARIVRYAIKSAAPRHFGIVIVCTTLPEQRRQLAQIGLHRDAVFGDCTGDRIPDDARKSDAWWVHFIAHKPRAAYRFG